MKQSWKFLCLMGLVALLHTQNAHAVAVQIYLGCASQGIRVISTADDAQVRNGQSVIFVPTGSYTPPDAPLDALIHFDGESPCLEGNDIPAYALNLPSPKGVCTVKVPYSGQPIPYKKEFPYTISSVQCLNSKTTGALHFSIQ